MNSSVLLVLAFAAATAAAQSADPSTRDVTVSFRPSVAIVIGVFAIMFTVTFLLLVYAKFCHTAAAELFRTALPGGPLSPPHRPSGIDKDVIRSLPCFRFSSLRGSRDGLECAVCLSRFQDAEILRLLPKCKHAFHVGCVDRWLEGHSSCPLCRSKVGAEDAAGSRSLLRHPSDCGGGGDLELFVEREPSARHSSSRFSIGGSFRKANSGTEEKKDALLAPEGGEGGGQLLHKFRHRIVVSGVDFRSRWSDVNSSDLMSLNSEMLHMVSSKRFAGSDPPAAGEVAASESRPSDERVVGIKEEMEKKRLLESKAGRMKGSHSVSISDQASASGGGGDWSGGGSRFFAAPGGRCVSEITSLSRFRVSKNPSMGGGSSSKEEKVRRVWLPIARRTVEWSAGREVRSQSNCTGQATNV